MTTGRIVQGPANEARLVRFDIRSRRADTMLTSPLGEAQPRSGPDATGRWITRLGLGPYAPVNAWAVRADGTLLRAEAATCTLTLFSPTGDSLRAWRVPFAPIPVTDSAWQACMTTARAQNRALLGRHMRDLSDTLKRGMAPPPGDGFEFPAKPASLPAIALTVAQIHLVGNEAWVPVHVADDAKHPAWDRLDLDTGERLARYTLPPRHRLLLVTVNGAYVVRVDDDDLEHFLLLRPPAP
jgi:hypothetical protein